MSTNANLPPGAFITTIDGKRCTAVPRNSNGGANDNAATQSSEATSARQSATRATTSQGSFSSSSSTTSSSPVQISTTTSEPPSSSSSPPPSSISSISNAASLSIASSPLPPSSSAPQSSPSIAPPDAAVPPLLAPETGESTAAAAPIPSVAPPDSSAVTAVPQTSQADDSITATLATVQTTSQQIAISEITESPVAESDIVPEPTAVESPTLSDAPAPLFTTIGTAAPSKGANGAAIGASTDSTSNDGTGNTVSSSTGSSASTTIAVAGGVIGGVAFVSLVAFLWWFWRRRVIKKRRSTLLTPLSVDPTNERGDGEKGPYVINRGSIGPTPRTERVKASFDANMKRLKGRISQLMTRNSTAPSPGEMTRGDPQYMNASQSHSRTSSVAQGKVATVKNQFMDWLSRLTAGAGVTRNSQSQSQMTRNVSGTHEKRPVDFTSQPDFLTLLGMDDRQLEREAQKRRMSASRVNGSASSTDHFLGGLNLDFNNDPFSDSNAIAHTSAQPAPLTVGQATTTNPFSDANAIPQAPKPSTYVAEIRRSRGQSVSQANRPPSSFRAPESVYRESVNSVDTAYGPRRNKFRSDPFDLERPELLGGTGRTTSSNVSTAGSSAPRLSDISSLHEGGGGNRLSGGVGTGSVRKPGRAHERSESFTSKYSSGVSLGEWSDPGPDVGPAASAKGSGRQDGVGRAM